MTTATQAAPPSCASTRSAGSTWSARSPAWQAALRHQRSGRGRVRPARPPGHRSGAPRRCLDGRHDRADHGDRPARARDVDDVDHVDDRQPQGRLAAPRIIPALLSSAGSTRDSYVERSLRTSSILGSPAFPGDEDLARARAYETYDRGWTASGVTRHMLAVLAQPDRTKDLAKLDLPVTVIHGLNDPLVHRSGGKAVANAVPGPSTSRSPGSATTCRCSSTTPTSKRSSAPRGAPSRADTAPAADLVLWGPQMML